MYAPRGSQRGSIIDWSEPATSELDPGSSVKNVEIQYGCKTKNGLAATAVKTSLPPDDGIETDQPCRSFKESSYDLVWFIQDGSVCDDYADFGWNASLGFH